MDLFSLGADRAMRTTGKSIGDGPARQNRVWLMAGAVLPLGFVITIAEPDPDVLARHVSATPNAVLIYTAAGEVRGKFSGTLKARWHI